MDVWLDDERNPKLLGRADARWFKTAEALQAWLDEQPNWSLISMSLDHDLGLGRMTGYDLIAWIEERVIAGGRVPPRSIDLHTQNPVGKERMRQARYRIYTAHLRRP